MPNFVYNDREWNLNVAYWITGCKVSSQAQAKIPFLLGDDFKWLTANYRSVFSNSFEVSITLTLKFNLETSLKSHSESDKVFVNLQQCH